MIRLDNTTRKLQAILGGAVTTNQLPVLVSWSDKTSTAYDGGSSLINTNGITAVDIVAAPAASIIRDIDFISIQNADTVSAAVTVRYNDNATLYTLFKAILAVGDQLNYTHGSGWQILDSTGAIKNSFSNGIWSTPRDLSLTGDATATLLAVDGSNNVSAALTLANVNANVGAFGSASKTLTTTANAKGQITAIAETNIAVSNAQVSGLGTMSTQNSGSVAITGGTITGLPTPTSSNDAATKDYVDTVAQGLDAKVSVIAASTANLTLSGTQTIDGIALVAGNRVLVKNQTAPAENGIYVVASGAWPRAVDADSWVELPSAFVFVEQGTVGGDTGWVCTVNAGGTLNTTAITWTQFSGAGSYMAGTGLSLSGTQFSISNTAVAAGSYGSTSKALSATVNAQGQLTDLSQADIAIANTQVSGLGTMSTQNADNIAITGGYINGVHVDSGGVLLKTNAGKLSVRDNADSAAAQIEIASIATGTPDGTKFVRDDGTLAVPAGGGASGASGAKMPVRVATTTAINLSAPGATIDGVTMAAGNRFLDKDNSTGANRGIYDWNGASTPATRSTDADGAGDMFGGMLVSVSEGTANGNSLWMLTTNDPITIGTTALTFLKPYADKGNNTDITSMTALTAPTVAANPVRATDLQAQLVTAFTTGGTETAFTLTPTPAITANAANQRFRVNFNAAAGTTPTLAVSGQAALNLKYKDSAGTKQAITATQVPINWISDVENDGTDWVVLSVATQNKPAFSVYKTSIQIGIANSTYTLVTWDVEEFDTDNSFASNRFTPKAAGNYLLNAHLLWIAGVDQSPHSISIYKNGSLYKTTRDFFSGPSSVIGNGPSNQITEIVKANGTTDYFEIYAWHNAGSSQALTGDSVNTVFSGMLL